MYVPAHFAELRVDEIHRILREHPFGALVSRTAAGLAAEHLPFDFDSTIGPHGILTGYFSRTNDAWTKLGDGDAVLVIFCAHDGYVSPNWYPSKHEAHRVVPTWNYQIVHAHGTIRICDDASPWVGIEVDITVLVAKSKLGQDEETRDRLGAAAVLDRRGATTMARAMREVD